MIDENIVAYEQEIKQILGPMGVRAKVSERESCFYLTVDGSDLAATKQDWRKKVGREFAEFVRVFVPVRFHAMDSVELSETSVEFRIGTLFDLMVNVEKYSGDQE
jgi:hypothetical protein